VGAGVAGDLERRFAGVGRLVERRLHPALEAAVAIPHELQQLGVG
jgi:hypothetical protein